MSILKYKYKAHKFINYAFYVIVFLIGFIIGFGSKEINFNKLISQVLMVDSVYAYDMTFSNSNTYNEEFVINAFQNSYSTFNYSDVPYIICTQTSAKSICHAMNENVFNALYIYKSYTSSHLISYNAVENATYYTIHINTDLSYYGSNSVINTNLDALASGYNLFTIYPNTSSTNKSYSNFNPGEIGSAMSSINSKVNVLDFSEYIVNLEFNEDLFKDNENFKQVCVENNKKFAITRNTNSEINDYFDYDYIWFPYGLDGLAKGLYDSSLEEKFSYYSEQDTFGYYWFKDKENIDNYFASDVPGLELEAKDYTDKYSYYGWSAHYFRMYFDGENTQFTIFEFVNPKTLFYNDDTDRIHGGGGLRLDGDEEIEISNEYCFYIKNEYEVQYINTDEWGDYYGTVTTPNGDYEFNTSYNKINSNTDNFLSQPISFINSIKDTINFINSLIYEFYISLPVLLRTFIITLIIILIIMLIMRIGGYR